MTVLPGNLNWQRFCGTNNPENDACVEFAEHGDTVVLRNSNDPSAETLIFTQTEVDNFALGWPNR